MSAPTAPPASPPLRALLVAAATVAALPGALWLRGVPLLGLVAFLAALIGTALVVHRPSVGAQLLTASLLQLLAAGGPSAPLAPACFLVWATAAVAALVLDHREQVAAGALLDALRRPARPDLAVASRTAAIALAVVVVATPLLVAGFVRVRAPRPLELAGGWLGVGAGSSDTLDFSPYLDTGRRFKVGHDLVMRVRAPAPAFWRATTYRDFDGRRWTRPAQDGRPLAGGRLAQADPPPEETGARYGPPFEQQFVLERGTKGLLYAAARVYQLRLPEGGATQESDGTINGTALGRGARYTVISLPVVASPEELRRSDPLLDPAVVKADSRSTATPAVARLAVRVAGGAPTRYDKAVAVQGWLARELTYTLDIPPLPAGRDAVEQLLFVDHKGFCQQLATAMVVMLRSLGVPARLAVGFSPGTYDPLSGVYQVREDDAHAWAEVYFPGAGWRDFDPTDAVPRAAGGRSRAVGTTLSRVGGSFLPASTPARALTLTVPLLAVAGLWVTPVVARRLRRRRVVPTWAGARLADLEAIGAARGIVRRPGDTVRAYARRLGDERLVDVADAVEADAYGPFPLPADERADVESALAATLL